MKQNIFETRQRAEEMLQQAISVWQQSAFSEQLEGLEQDPVFTLLMTALAYQANEMDSELERLKTDVLEDYAQMLVPYEVGHAIPATVIVETAPGQHVAELELSDHDVFRLSGTDYSFIPLFQTRVLNADIVSVVRLDGRRWKVTLAFNGQIDNISNFSFAVKGAYQDLKVTIGGKQLPLIRPWDYSQLPLTLPFGLDTMLYSHMYSYDASASCLDLYARHNTRIYFIKSHPDEMYYPKEMEKVEMVFEFSGIADDFVLNKSMLSLNSVVLVNATIKTATLSLATPIVRIAGFDHTENRMGEQFMHLLRPADEQIYAESPVEVRYVAGDRFNSGSLVKLLNALNTKFHTDYYAFQQKDDMFNDGTIQALQGLLARLADAVQRDKIRNIPGVYLILRDKNMSRKGSLDIKYLMTTGTQVNQVLTNESSFDTPNGLDSQQTRQIVAPVPGTDQVSDLAAAGSLTRYLIATSDRIVTPADIKLFCYSEMHTRYGIVRSMIRDITVDHRNRLDRRGCGYEIVVGILLVSNSYVQRTFAGKIPQVEMLLQKKIEVRSTNIYPVRVDIKIE